MKCTNKFVIFGQFAIRKLSILLKNYEQIVNFWFSSGFRHFFEHFPPFFWCFCMICLLFPYPIFFLQDVADVGIGHTMCGRGAVDWGRGWRAVGRRASGGERRAGACPRRDLAQNPTVLGRAWEPVPTGSVGGVGLLAPLFVCINSAGAS